MTGERLCFAMVYLAEGLIVWLYYERVFVRRGSLSHTLLTFALCYTALFLLSSTDNILLNTLAFLLGNCILLRLDYTCRLKTAVLHSALLTFIMSSSEIIVTLIINTVVHDYNAYTYNGVVMVALAVCSKLLFFFIAVFLSRTVKPVHTNRNETNMTALFSVMPVVSAIIALTIIYIGVSVPLVALTEILMSVSVIALLLLNIIVLVIYNRIQVMDAEHLELSMSSLRDHADAEYYKMLKEQYDRQRVLIHDIQNHFGAIEGLAEDGKSEEIKNYIRRMENSPELKGKNRMCDDSILNMILIRYDEFCSENNINFHCDVRADAVSFLDSSSIAALFGNLVSNAVEAASLSYEKLVDLSVIKYTEQSRVVITVVNSCDVRPKVDRSGGLISTKQDAENHGCGMKSIDRIVKKHGGTAKNYYNEAEKMFHYIIQFDV